MEPWYRFETLPITQQELPGGGTKTNFGDLAGRVVDSYTNMPIGLVGVEGDGRFHARPFLPDSRAGEVVVKEIEGDWGPRFDVAAGAIWRQYWRQFSLRDKAPRYLWRYHRLGWLVLGTIFGAVAQLVLRNL